MPLLVLEVILINSQLITRLNTILCISFNWFAAKCVLQKKIDPCEAWATFLVVNRGNNGDYFIGDVNKLDEKWRE